MLLIANPDLPVAFETAAERLPARFRRLAFWEQISDVVQTTGGTDDWRVDDLPLSESEKIVFASFPKFAELEDDASAYSSFLHSEWQSTLTTLLWERRRFILNGYWLVGTLWLQRNRHLFLPQMWNLGWPCAESSVRTNSVKVRALLANWSVQTYPVPGVNIVGCGNSNELISKTQLFLMKSKIDALILEFSVDEESFGLVGTYLWPPFHSELGLITDFLTAKVGDELKCRESLAF